MIEVDVVVIGSGFGGSIAAAIAARLGHRVALIERGSHPRFAIGESATPQAGILLAAIADRYDLPGLAPLASYGSWMSTCPHVQRGLKRGFSYFHHQAGAAFTPRDDRGTELLVAASACNDESDTHWFRADVDSYLVQEAVRAGATFLDETRLDSIQQRDGWHLAGRRGSTDVEIRAAFVIDASGAACVLANTLGIPQDPTPPRTRSRALYAHFRGVSPWGGVYDDLGGDRRPHPFPTDAAALHHVFEGGWMYVLHFDSGITSAGFLLDVDHWPLDTDVPVEQEWHALLDRFPSIAAQFATAQAVRPFHRSGLLQRRVDSMTGDSWMMLPHAAAFIDPMHSGGIAHTLAAIERLGGIFEAEEPLRPALLAGHARTTARELDLLDRLVAGGYTTSGRFDLFRCLAMYYFAGADHRERQRRAGDAAAGTAWLNADDEAYCSAVAGACEEARHLVASGADGIEFESRVARDIEPWNHVGLCDRQRANLYDYA